MKDYDPNEKVSTVKPKSNHATTFNDISAPKIDQRLNKPTIYDLAGKSDWRKGMKQSSGQMRGPIDHVAKNKSAYNKATNQNNLKSGGYSYIKKNTISPSKA